MEQKLKDLLNAAGKITAKYPSAERQEDPMNLFRILGLQRREIYLCRVLVKLIDPDAHDKGAAFLKLFFNRVLNLPISPSECEGAAVSTEYVIDGNRRIDIYIQSEAYTIPIEAKIDEGDRATQLLDYFRYAKNAPIYYLTLDGHPPGEESIASKNEDGGRLQEQDYCCISFAYHLTSWIDACLKLCEDTPSTEIVLQQFKDILTQNTTDQRGSAAMDIAKELINTAESFHLATAIAEGLQEAKTQKMQHFFSAIAEQLAVYGAIAADTESIAAYYKRKKSTWPGIMIPLSINGNQEFALRIEIDHCLFYGICNYHKDAAPYFNDHRCMDENKEAIRRKDFVIEHLMPQDMRTLNSTDAFYWWRYLPTNRKEPSVKVLDFLKCNDAYIGLYNPEVFQNTVEHICGIIEDFLQSIGQSRYFY